MSTLLTLVVTFLLTGVIGNRLIPAWQFRNWLKQQRFLGAEKEYIELKHLFDEIVTLLGRRLTKMQRLRASFGLRTAVFEERLAEYDAAISEWNERIPSFNVRLTILANWDLTKDLEQIQEYLHFTGAELERLCRLKIANKNIPTQDQAVVVGYLDYIQGSIFKFNREILKLVEQSHANTYHGIEIRFSSSTLRSFGSWHLIKALFVPIEKVPSIYRSAIDPIEPRFLR